MSWGTKNNAMPRLREATKENKTVYIYILSQAVLTRNLTQNIRGGNQPPPVCQCVQGTRVAEYCPGNSSASPAKTDMSGSCRSTLAVGSSWKSLLHASSRCSDSDQEGRSGLGQKAPGFESSLAWFSSFPRASMTS